MSDTLAFVSCADSGELHVLRLSADGQLHTAQVLALGGQLMPMALSPDQTQLYVARRSDPLAVIALAVDAAAGSLSVLGESPLPASMASLHTDRTGRWLFSASYGADMVAVQALSANGTASAAATHATGRHAHCVLADPTNRFVVAASLGGGQLHRYHFDAATGDLSPMDAPVFPMPTGTGPRHLVTQCDACAWHAGRQHRAGRKASVVGDDGDVVIRVHADGEGLHQITSFQFIARVQLSRSPPSSGYGPRHARHTVSMCRWRGRWHVHPPCGWSALRPAKSGHRR